LTPPVTPTYNSYYVEAHNCGVGCEYGAQFYTYAKFPSSYSAVAGKFYLQASGFQDYSYKIINSVDPSLGGTLCSTTPYDTCYAACGTTPPVSLTPSVTPPTPCPSTSATPAYNFYYMNRYVCYTPNAGQCNFVENILVATYTTINSTTRYYVDDNTADIYKKTGDASYDVAYILNTTNFNTTCNALCNI
jgi:hypothetical protein